MVHIQSSSAKKSVKGEDFLVIAEDLTLALTLTPPQCSLIRFNIYAVFDGHGSQAVANYCKSNLVPTLKEAFSELNSHPEPLALTTTILSQWENLAQTALHRTFKSIDEYACARFERSGSTATVCCIAYGAGLEQELGSRAHVIVANVGDSNAILDSGEATFRLNEDHRLGTNRAEQERIREAGGVVEKETAKDCLRLWPGGLMMSRTLGDRDAVHAIPDPDIRSALVSVSPQFGSRIVIASDGLWDAVPPKMAASSVRKKKTHPASQSLVQLAAKRAGKDKDDITVIVIDLVNEEGQRPFETLMASSGSVVQRRQRSMSLSALQPVFWKTGQDVVPEFTPLRHEVENGTQEDAREQEEERERKEEISREHISFVDDTLSLQKALALSVAEEDEGEWQAVAPRRRKSSQSKQTTPPEEKEEVQREETESKGLVEEERKGTEKTKQRRKQRKKTKAQHVEGDKPKPQMQEEAKGSVEKMTNGERVNEENELNSSGKEAVTAKQQRRKKKQVCFQFLKGKCAKGEACQYAHKERKNRRAKQALQAVQAETMPKMGNPKAKMEIEAKGAQEKPQRRRRMDVYISGLVEASHSKQEMRKYIEQFGKIASMHYRKRRNGQQYGFCLVGFQDTSDMDKILAVERHVLNEVEINVSKYAGKQ